MYKVMIAGLLLFVISSLSFAGSLEPKISLKEALKKAERYVTDQKLDTSDLFLKEVRRTTVSREDCWMILWAPKSDGFLDGDMRIIIFDDGRIVKLDEA